MPGLFQRAELGAPHPDSAAPSLEFGTRSLLRKWLGPVPTMADVCPRGTCQSTPAAASGAGWWWWWGVGWGERLLRELSQMAQQVKGHACLCPESSSPDTHDGRTELTPTGCPPTPPPRNAVKNSFKGDVCKRPQPGPGAHGKVLATFCRSSRET